MRSRWEDCGRTYGGKVVNSGSEDVPSTERKISGGNSYGLRLRNGNPLVEPTGNGDDNGTDNGEENGSKHGYNGNGKPDILTCVWTGHFNLRLTPALACIDK